MPGRPMHLSRGTAVLFTRITWRFEGSNRWLPDVDSDFIRLMVTPVRGLVVKRRRWSVLRATCIVSWFVRTIAVSAARFPNPPGCRKSPARAFDTPLPATICRATPAPVLLPGATSPAPLAVLQYPAATCPRNARAKITRRKTQLPAAEIQIPSLSPRERIGLRPPWRKRSLPKTLPPSSSTVDFKTRFRQRPFRQR